MTDLIRRQDAIEELRDVIVKDVQFGDELTDGYNDGIDMAITVISKLPSSQSEQRWIPCSERLPKFGERVLCQCQSNIYEVLKLTVDGWYYNPSHCYMESFVIAWQPLPQPYTESEVQ